MKPSIVHVLIGLLVALLPWLPSCPARIAAADLPPSPPKGGNFSADSRSQEPSLAIQPGGGAISNAVVVSEEKAEARSVIPLSESSGAATNCTGDQCRHTAIEEHPASFGNNSSNKFLRGPAVVEEDAAVVPRGSGVGSEEGPLPPVGGNHAAEDENGSPPGHNGIEEASKTAGALHPIASGRNGTSSSNATQEGAQFLSDSKNILTVPATGPGRNLGRPSGVEGNDVFSSTQGAHFRSELSKISDNKMVAEGDAAESVSERKVTSTPASESKVTATSMSGSEKDSSVHKAFKQRTATIGKAEEDGDDEVHREEMDDEMEGAEDDDDGLWDSQMGGDGERTTTLGNLPMGGGGVNLYFREFTRIEAHDSEEPGTTRSYVVVEKGTKVDYSSSSVVSEVYDSELPVEEESTRDPSSLQEASESKHNNSTSTRLDTAEGHMSDDDNTDTADDLEDELDEIDGEQNPSLMTSLVKGPKDQEQASGEISTFTTSVKTTEDVKPTVAVPSSMSTKGATETLPTPDRIPESLKHAMEDSTGASNSMHSPATVGPTMPIPQASEEGSIKTPNTEKNIPSSTAAYSLRTSRRLNIAHSSTTESSIKNEVTYHENTTGPVYDFKANISLTTPMVYLMSSTSPTPSTVTQTNWSEMNSQVSTTVQPSVSTTTGSTPLSISIPSQSTTSTEIADTQVGGNSINDWTTIGDIVETATNQETNSQTMIESSGSDTSEVTTPSPSVLFTTVQKSDVTDLRIENMSVNTTLGEEIMVTEPSSAATYTRNDSISVSGGSTGSSVQQSGSETKDTMASSTVTSSSEPTSSEGSSTDSTTYSSSTDTISIGDISSSTSDDLHSYEVDSKVPPVTLVHISDISASDSDSSAGDTNHTVTVQPISTTTGSNTTASPADLTHIFNMTSKKIAEVSPGMKITPETTVQQKDSKVKGTTSTTKEPDLPSGEEVDNEVSFIAYPAYVRLWMKISWSEICRKQLQLSLKQALAQLISSSAHSNVPIDRVMLLNFAESCLGVSQEAMKSEQLSAVHFCILSGIMGPSGRGQEDKATEGEEKPITVVHCDATLMQLFLHAWNQTPKPLVEPLTHVQEVDIVNSSFGAGNEMELPVHPADDKTGIQAAIGISCISAVCLLFLATLLIIMRRRQRRFNYGQRCTPVSLDDYSLDSVSVREGARGGRGQARNGNVSRGVNGLAKGDGINDWRASKRSYGNPAFEDDDGEEVLVSKPLNFAMLTNAAMDEDGALADEFRLIPKKFYKRTVRRKSRSRYKDPAASAERGEAGASSKDGDDDDENLPEGAEEKNRYANVVPLTSTRVRLTAKPSGPLSTYINANYVMGPQNKERFYIACQAPLQSTVEDFWRMIWEQQSKVILMLTNLVENSVEKCADYLPPSEVLDCHRLFGDYQVTLKKREVREKYIVSSLQLKDMESNLWREVTHLWFLGWPDQGVPEEPNQIIAFLIEARPFMKTNPGPTVVHCSPGTGRTGTVIAIDISIRDFEQSRMVDVPEVVQRLRRDRAGAVQTHQQYAFIYKALSLYATKLTGGAMDSF